jgi:hypothetical protein
MGGFSGKPRADHEGGPRGVFIKKSTEGFEKKGEVLLIGLPAAGGDDLVLFGDSRVEFKDIGLNRVRNAVDLFWVDPEAGSEGFPKNGRVRGFYRHGWEQFQSAGQASLDPGSGKDGSEGVEN